MHTHLNTYSCTYVYLYIYAYAHKQIFVKCDLYKQLLLNGLKWTNKITMRITKCIS